MAKCDLCSDEDSILYTVESPKETGGKEYHLCESCLETVHEAYVEIK